MAEIKKVMIVGRIASGKTTASEYFVEKYGAIRISLAGPIKVMESAIAAGEEPIAVANKYMGHLEPMQLAMMVKILRDALLLQREEPKPRKRLQFIGTEGGRKRISDNIWIECADIEANKHAYAVIDDVRFPNEFGYFNIRHWTSIALTVNPEVQRSRIEALYGTFDPETLIHPSELGVQQILDTCGYTHLIDTSYLTKEQLHEEIAKCISG